MTQSADNGGRGRGQRSGDRPRAAFRGRCAAAGGLSVLLILGAAAWGQSSPPGDASAAGSNAQPRRANDPAPQQGEAPQLPPQTGDAALAEDDEKRGARVRRTSPRVADWSRMSSEEQAELERFIAKWFPEVWTELQADRETKPRVYRQRMERLAQEVVPLIDQYDQSPKRGELSIREWQLEFRLKVLVSDYLLQTNVERRAKLAKDITDSVTDRFQVRQQRRWLDIVSLEERLARLKELHNEKTTNQDKIIQREVSALLNPAGAVGEGADRPEEPEPESAAQESGD